MEGGDNSDKKDLNMSKWLSRRWIITVWSMFMVTGSDQWSVLSTTLVAVPVAYTSLETLNKKGRPNEAK